MLNFLEISATSENLIRDLGVFEDLAFQPLVVNETWAHQYGVMSDGDFHIGLHGRGLQVPTLTFVLPDLEKHILPLQDSGIEFDFIHIGDERFHEAGFTDGAGQTVWLLEARTFSPTLPDDEQTSLLGKLREIRLPAQHQNHQQWAALGLEENPSREAPLRLDDSITRLTVVYETALEPLIMLGARRGWKNFSVTKNDEVLIKTAQGFDFLILDI